MNVLKLGGSLLTCPDLIERLCAVINRFQIAHPIVVVGGGTAARQVRQLQQLCGFDDEAAHWMAIDAMVDNAQTLCRLSRQLQLCESPADAVRIWDHQRIPLVHAGCWIEAAQTHAADQAAPTAVQRHGGAIRPPSQIENLTLPATWDVTSDSIAAWIARCWSAESLWLLKSCDTDIRDPAELARLQLVDAWFPNVCSPDLNLRWVNVRKL